MPNTSKALVWDNTGEKFYETGVSHGVLYVFNPEAENTDNTKGAYGTGVVWNGLTAVTESPSGAEATPLYADDIKYLNLVSAEEFGATIEAYTYPDEFAACDGSAEIGTGMFVGQQTRKTFAFSYRTVLGNDVQNNEYGYKLHIVYGCLAAPSEKAYATINDSPEAITFSWEVSTTPVDVTVNGKKKKTAVVTLDSVKVGEEKMAQIEAALYGSESADAKLLMPDEIAAIIAPAAG
jgi:hypothetical protein